MFYDYVLRQWNKIHSYALTEQALFVEFIFLVWELKSYQLYLQIYYQDLVVIDSLPGAELVLTVVLSFNTNKQA